MAKRERLAEAAAVFVGALVAAFPEELVDQVAVGTVDFHAVHADALGILGRLGERGDHVLNVLFGHAVHHDLTVLHFFRRAITRHARRPARCRCGARCRRCHSCGTILPPSACTASTTFFQPASAASP